MVQWQSSNVQTIAYSKRRAAISQSIRINEAIRAKELRVIGTSGEQLGIVARDEALKLAEEAGVDLVEISPNADPPVAKIIDWGKYQYQKMKEQQKNRKSSKQSELKQMRFGLKIGSGDLDIKLRKIRGFLSEGHKVRIQIFYRGREMAHKELGYEMIEKIIALLEDDAIVEQKPQMAGRNLSIVIRSK
jgi:translation initiation factor IF-3